MTTVAEEYRKTEFHSVRRNDTMYETYEELKIEVIVFAGEDVITASGEETGGNDSGSGGI